MLHPKVENLLARPRIDQHTGQWYSARRVRLTASDVPAVLGHNKYCSRREVFLRKTGQKESQRFSVACDHGHKYEAMAARAYSAVTGLQCIPQDIGLVVHENYDQFGASPDRIVATDVAAILVEIKCPWKRKIDPDARPNIPAHYIDQIEFQMAVCDMDICHFVEFIPGSVFNRGTLKIVEKKRDPAWWDRNFKSMADFWSDVTEYWDKNPYKKPGVGKLPQPKPEDQPEQADTEFVPDNYDIFIDEYKAV